jgi:hypothetical protein
VDELRLEFPSTKIFTIRREEISSKFIFYKTAQQSRFFVFKIGKQHFKSWTLLIQSGLTVITYFS